MKLILLFVFLFGLLAVDMTRKGYVSFASNSTAKPSIKQDKSLNKAAKLLRNKSIDLRPAVIDKVINTLHCAKKNGVEHNNILTVIDYSLPSSKKRLWVFNLSQSKLLYHTYVSHGLRSGSFSPTYFSNKNNSKASSLGVFNTEKKYYGRYGIALKLQGLEENFNDNAYARFIVMHGSWYVNEDFINKYGRAGRSWGCPSLPLNVVTPIINTIKNNSIMVVYYPSDDWLKQSKFIHCEDYKVSVAAASPIHQQEEDRGDIVYVDLNTNDVRDKDEPVLAVSAKHYREIFDKKPPLKRMLRRQINQAEYIVINSEELKHLDSNNDKKLTKSDKAGLKQVYFVKPEVKKLRGYYATEMKIISLGKINNVKLQTTNAVVSFKKNPSVVLRATDSFIRWLGL